MRITAREKRLIIIGAVVLVAVSVFYTVDRFLPDSEDLSQGVELRKRKLLKEREILSQEELYRTQLEQHRKRLKQDMGRFLPGDNVNVAAAELQTLLKGFADQSGVEITQRNALQSKKIQDSVMKVSVKIETNCNPEQLVRFLAAIKNYEKLLRIDEFMVSSYRIQKRFEIRPILTVSGFINVPEATSEKKPTASSGSPESPDVESYRLPGKRHDETLVADARTIPVREMRQEGHHE